MATGVGVSSCCLSGKIQQGNPAGREEVIGGLSTYVSEPEGGSKSKTVVFITDIFGWKLPNVRLLADNYAKAGFYCYIPDLHQGDSLPIEFLQDVEPPLPVRQGLTVVQKTVATAKVGATLGPWLIKHRESVTKPLLDTFLAAVRSVPGTHKLGAVGFCWGGRYAILATHPPPAEEKEAAGRGGVVVVDAAVACHPSLVAVPGDFEGVAKPLSLALGSEDSLLDGKAREQIEELLEKKKGEVPYELEIYQDQVHGFSLRGDWSSEEDKKAMDQAEKQGIEWLKKYLA